MQNVMGQAASIKNDGKMILPFPKDLKMSFIDVRDTAAVAARILKDPSKHNGKIHDFTGEQTTYGDFANVMSEVLGKPVTLSARRFEAAEAGMKSRNMPDWLVGHMLAIAKVGAKGGFTAEKTEPVREIVGRAPITTRQFVQDHKAALS